MTAIDDLARQAREVLATSSGGTLHIPDAELPPGTDLGDLSLLSYDDAGRPGFLCGPGSPVATVAAAGCPAVLCVPAPRLGPDAATLVLTGRLGIRGCDEIGGDAVLSVALEVESVVVEQRSTDGTGTLSTPVPLQQYLDIRPDPADDLAEAPNPLDETAAQLVEHTNAAHASELRLFVAQLRGIPVADILAAELSALDGEAVEIRWLDARGAHTARLFFERAAHCPASLAHALRTILAGAPR